MSLRKSLTGSLLSVLFCTFLLAGCLGGSDDPDVTGDAAMDDDPEDAGGDAMGKGGDGMDDGSDEGDDGSEPGDDPDEQDPQDEPPEKACTPTVEALTSWSHDGPAVPAPDEADPAADPLLLLAQVSNESFDVPEGTEALIVSASAGDHLTLGWEVVLIDPTGSPEYTFSGEPGPGVEGVTGEAILETDTITAPVSGAWTLQASVTGYVEGLQIQIDADVCR